MKVIYKYQLDTSDLDIPVGRIVHVGIDPAHHLLDQKMRDQKLPCVWVEHQTPDLAMIDNKITEVQLTTERQRLRVVGTGQQFLAHWSPVGTVLNGPFAWHVIRCAL